MWYTFFGALVAVLVATGCTLIFGGNDPTTIDSNLIAPFIRKRFRTKNLPVNLIFLLIS